MPAQGKPSIVSCRGIWADGSCLSPPDLERFTARRIEATTYEAESSHVTMLSHPDVVLDVIRTAASSVRESLATA
jgi:hypothetical protein